jgi:ABC-type multidrug transport system fused ATPase/permease subunit
VKFAENNYYLSMSKTETMHTRRSVILRSLKVLPKSDKPKIVAVALLQVFLGFMDLLGVAAIGILGALAITGIQSKEPGNRVSAFLNFVGLNGVEFQKQVAILGLVAALVLIIRTIFSVIITRKVFFFLSHRGAAISANLTSRLLARDLLFIQSQSTQQTLFSLTTGVNSVTLGILGNATTLLADSSLLLIMTIGLFIVDPIIAISTLGLFGGLGLILYLRMNVKAQTLGSENSSLAIQSNQQIIEVLDSYRELVVRNRRDYYSRQIAKVRHQLAETTAELQFMPNISKYVIESGVVLGAIVVSGIQFLFQDAAHAVATLSVFLASGTRIAPAIMRLQHGAIALRSSIGSANATLEMIDSLSDTQPIQGTTDEINVDHLGFNAEVSIEGAYLKYPSTDRYALENITLKFLPGESIAIVGPSGAGKTSLVDVLLGVLLISSGSILISGKSPEAAISNWPGAISYVPQDVTISDATLGENVSLGYPSESVNMSFVWEALEVAQLTDFVNDLPGKLETLVGERGTKISGGQRQRLGIARAMYTKPKLLVLDEATSSLDGQTESDISDAIQNLRGDVTVVMIAHRLSTVRNADKVVYMQDGSILAVGTFEEVRAQVPDFDSQASLMGL